MRVALVNVTTTTKVGGVETFVWQLGESLQGRGVDVTIFGGVQARGANGPAGSSVPVVTTPFIDRAAVRRVPLLKRQYGAAKLLERLSYGVSVRSAIERGNFDVVHIHKPFDFPLAAFLRRRTGARVVYSSHGRDYFPADRRFVGAIDAITACSAFNAADVRARYNRDATIVYNGIDTARFAPRPRDRAWRASIGIGEAPLIVWVGRLVRWKGTIDALRALALSPARAHLVVVGDGAEMARLRGAAQSLGIAERVHFMGMMENDRLPAVYTSADVVIGTSFANETFGISLAEASACGRPIVASAFGGFREVVRDGVTGLLVPPRDPAALARAIDTVLADPERAGAMGAAGRAFVSEQFSWPAVTDRVLAVYRQVLHAD